MEELVKRHTKEFWGAALTYRSGSFQCLTLTGSEFDVDRDCQLAAHTRLPRHNACAEPSNQISLWQVARRATSPIRYDPREVLKTEPAASVEASFMFGRQQLILGDCFEWLERAAPNSISAVVTDPPYGLLEYQPEQQRKLRAGRGGVWRIPPSFDGANRKPLPRFTILSKADREGIRIFFQRWAELLHPVLRPGAHVAVAGNPLVSTLVAHAMEQSGFERRGEIVRLVRTFRGGDRPKGAEAEFPQVSSMPRACWEPWGLYRKPIETRTLAENLRKWGTGGLRRISADTPFLDVIESGTTPDAERVLAPHPSVKPQAFLRKVVRGLMPSNEGVVLDTFAGCATTLAACEALGLQGVGIEVDRTYFELGRAALGPLAGRLPRATS